LNPLPEVSGGCALHADPVSPTDFADAFISLQNKRTREELIRKGYENAKRFNVSRMTHAYLDLHGFKSTKTWQQNENPFACS
jgi:hypothetical protein